MRRLRTAVRAGGIGFVVGFLASGLRRGLRAGFGGGVLVGLVAAALGWVVTERLDAVEGLEEFDEPGREVGSSDQGPAADADD